MSKHGPELSRRERQIMDIVYSLSEPSAAQVRDEMEDPPSYSTVRKLLSILVEKGHLKHRSAQGKYLFKPTKRRDRAGKSALARAIETFFEGSIEKAVAALVTRRNLPNEELDRLAKLIDEARRERK